MLGEMVEMSRKVKMSQKGENVTKNLPNIPFSMVLDK